MEYDPTNPEAFQLMASCLLSQQNMDEARNMLEKSLELWQGKDEELPQVCAEKRFYEQKNMKYRFNLLYLIAVLV